MNFSNIKLSISIDQKSFTKINYRPFIAGVIAVFILKIFTILGLVNPAAFLSPIPGNIDQFESLKPKLEMKMNEFSLKVNHSLIPPAYAGEDYDEAKAYAVVNLDSGEVLAEKDIDTKASIASITKVMTAVVALDLASPDERFTVTEKAAKVIPTKIGVVPGQQLTLEELLHASLMTSANDAAQVIADGINEKYGQDVFVRAMNEKADFIGMKNTHFANPQGFDDPKHYSTPEDLALLAHYALTKYPLISEIVKKDKYELAANEYHKKFDLYNWNGLIGVI
jgi:D-alanyl-D-alanine carboxypeptidase